MLRHVESVLACLVCVSRLQLPRGTPVNLVKQLKTFRDFLKRFQRCYSFDDCIGFNLFSLCCQAAVAQGTFCRYLVKWC